MSRPIYSVRVTALECFRMWMFGITEQNEGWNTEQGVIDTIMEVKTVNVKADYGSSGHLIIEHPDSNKTATGYKVDKFTFNHTQVRPILKYVAEHPYMTREVPIAKLYHTQHFDLIITGTCDALEGLFVRDNKFKFSSYSVEDYYESFQWRLYLHILGLDYFVYDFFRVKGFEHLADCEKAVIEDVESMPMFRYEGMEEDINTLLNDFADWIVFKGLQQYLVITPAKYKKIIKGDSRLRNLITP